MDPGQGPGQGDGESPAEYPARTKGGQFATTDGPRGRPTPNLRQKLSENGRKGGRPATRFRYREKIKRIEQEIRAQGRIVLVPLAFRYVKAVLEGRIVASEEVRAGLARDVFDRFGFPKKSEIHAEVDIGVKHVELSGYRDSKGVWHEVPWDEVEAADVVDEEKELPPHEGRDAGASDGG